MYLVVDLVAGFRNIYNVVHGLICIFPYSEIPAVGRTTCTYIHARTYISREPINTLIYYTPSTATHP